MTNGLVFKVSIFVNIFKYRYPWYLEFTWLHNYYVSIYNNFTSTLGKGLMVLVQLVKYNKISKARVMWKKKVKKKSQLISISRFKLIGDCCKMAE